MDLWIAPLVSTEYLKAISQAMRIMVKMPFLLRLEITYAAEVRMGKMYSLDIPLGHRLLPPQ